MRTDNVSSTQRPAGPNPQVKKISDPTKEAAEIRARNEEKAIVPEPKKSKIGAVTEPSALESSSPPSQEKQTTIDTSA